MSEKPLDRLNYYNGQRLEASDLRLEQEYHMRVRRWLNRSLYSAGIVQGLTVSAEQDGQPLRVMVSPGLALDVEGREIILLEEQRLPVVAMPSSLDGLPRSYLTIEYRERRTAEESLHCMVHAQGNYRVEGRPSWGGPAFVRAEPRLGWTDSIPHPSSGKIILARVELDRSCSAVQQVDASVRDEVVAKGVSKVSNYALEGARDIDERNPQRIYFHARGQQPNAVTLYLRAEAFPRYHYTEMGQHSHHINIDQKSAGGVNEHSHTLNSVETSVEKPDIRHSVHARTEGNIDTNKQSVIELAYTTEGGGQHYSDLTADIGTGIAAAVHHLEQHRHGFEAGARTGSEPAVTSHSHGVVATAARVGINTHPALADPPFPVRSTTPLSYVGDLHVYIDGKPVTTAIVEQLKGGDSNWSGNSGDKLGDRTSSHPLVTRGTGPIRLDFLPAMRFDLGEHFIELSVTGDGNGGRILYNLYVE